MPTTEEMLKILWKTFTLENSHTCQQLYYYTLWFMPITSPIVYTKISL